MATTINATMQQRIDTAANLTSANATYLSGEVVIESDTKKQKVGDGSTAWTSLAYQTATNTNQSVYAAGTVYTMTATPAVVTFGTTSPALTIATAGIYLLMGFANAIYNSATYAGTQTINFQLFRTNNTPAGITNATITCQMRVLTTITDNVGNIGIPTVVYTAVAGDVISVYGSVSATPAAGSVQCNSASITAIRIG